MTAIAKKLLARDPALLSEVELSGLVVELARLGGWTRRYHTLRSKGSTSGFPDWVFVKGPRLLFVELKSEAGKVRPDQQEWIDALNEVGDRARSLALTLWEIANVLEQPFASCVDLEQARKARTALDAGGKGFAPRSVQAVVWKPSDWDEIVETLTGKRPIEAAA